MRSKRFTLLCDDNERKLIEVLAEYLNRTQGDTIRYLVKIKAKEIGIDSPRSISSILSKEKENE